ncbi:MAG TPA: DNA mismatch repair endonuclease MutL, partial [Pyrinomonadaceae bacterium]|nr:DNA mismatch repair endonuclease MutL [Pyrinomonadaceae bacterium]
SPAARPRGTTVVVRDLFFNVPARRKFLRSEATESFHLANLVTHYALAHPEIAFALTNNGREVLRAAPAENLRERAYQIFGDEFVESLLAVAGGFEGVGRVTGFVSAPRARRTTRDAQYLFVNGRYVRDRLVARALTEGYRTVLPHGVYPSALLFLEVPLEEVDVNVHPAKTEVRFRRAAAVSDAVREAVRAALAAGGFLRSEADAGAAREASGAGGIGADESDPSEPTRAPRPSGGEPDPAPQPGQEGERQEAIDFGWTPAAAEESPWRGEPPAGESPASPPALGADEPSARRLTREEDALAESRPAEDSGGDFGPAARGAAATPAVQNRALPPVSSAAGLVREVAAESLAHGIRPLGQLDDSFIIATDSEGLLLIDQHVAHERILFDQYRRLEGARAAESQHLLVPETFDLTPAQAAAFDEVAEELERYGFSLMRLSGRTVAVRAVPADLPAGELRGLLREALDTVDAEKRGRARATRGEALAASLACHAAVKANTPLTAEKMRWLVERLLRTSSPTTCPHGRPVILRLNKRDIERGFQRP